MRIVIAGGTGFLGGPLAEVYAEEGHDVRVLTRGLPPGEARHDPGTGVPGVTRVGWKPDGQSGPWASAIDGADAVVNLAGAGIADARWTPQRKAELRDSRIVPTRSLVAAIASVGTRPPVFVSGSGVNYYGTSGDEPKTEAAPPGTTSSRTCARTGKRRPAARRARRRAWCRFAAASCSSEAAARSRG